MAQSRPRPMSRRVPASTLQGLFILLIPGLLTVSLGLWPGWLADGTGGVESARQDRPRECRKWPRGVGQCADLGVAFLWLRSLDDVRQVSCVVVVQIE